jgi:hypothetical protein
MPEFVKESHLSSPSGRNPTSSGLLRINQARGNANTIIVMPTPKEVVLQPNRSEIFGSVPPMHQANKNGIPIPPTAKPSMTTAIACVFLRTNQWFMTVIIGSQPPKAAPKLMIPKDA